MRGSSFEDVKERPFERIIVISLSGVGDTILSTPLCRALRGKYRDAHLCGLTMWKGSAAVLGHLAIFNEIIQHDFFRTPLRQSLEVLRNLRKRRFDLSVVVYPANRAHYDIVSWLIHARYRLGHEYLVGHSLTYWRYLLTHRVRQTQGTHNVHENLKLAETLGIPWEASGIDIGTLGEDEAQWAEQLCAGKPPPRLGIHPGCSPLKNHTYRRWPAERYAQLACQFSARTGGSAMVFLGPDETGLKSIFEEAGPGTTLVSDTSIERVAAAIRRCDLFICSDSSLGHMAAACSVPVIMILGPTNSDYIHPWGVPYRIVSRRLPCSPCFEISRSPLRCKAGLNYACIRDIDVGTVLESCLDLLRGISRDLRVTGAST